MMQTAEPGGASGIAKLFERALFRRRSFTALVFLIASLLLGWQATKMRPDASFQKMVPTSHPFIANYLANETELRALGNQVRIVVETAKGGDIYTPEFLALLKDVTDEVFYLPGIDRGNLKSLWTPNVLWFEVTEDGYASGKVVPDGFDGSAAKVEQARANVARANIVGSLVANDHRSAMVLAPLLDNDPTTGRKLDYGALSERIETMVRTKYSSPTVRIHVTGFAKLVGDLMDGARGVVLFFAASVVLTVFALWLYCRCWRSTFAAVLCCGLAVAWQLGLVRLLGFGLDPYSTLVPFLTFAIGVSHAVQNINTMALERLRGHDAVTAAQNTFSMLFVPGSVALLCDAVGFSTLMVIDIGVIRELAISACIGVAVIILTKMFLLPVLMSWLDVSPAGLRRAHRRATGSHRVARALSRMAEPRGAAWAVSAAAVLLGGSLWVGRDLKVGDLDPGAPELRQSSRYNQDVAYVGAHYSVSPDVFVVMVKTAKGECGSYPVAEVVDRFEWAMQAVPGVQSTRSLFDVMKDMIAADNGGNLKWVAITRDRYISNSAHRKIPSELYNAECSMLPVLMFLGDHKAETLTRIVEATQAFAAANQSEQARFELAAGNAGIEAATNIVVKQSERLMLVLVYAIVGVLVWWEFRSWRVALALLLPLYVTSALAEAVMVMLGLGIKVATLPVIALGVGIGVDYGIYLYNRMEHFRRRGLGLQEAYFQTLKTTGAAVALTGVMLALGVAMWNFSAIKFQADMGLLLTFMFVWNMVGAIVMVPALTALLVRWEPAAAVPGTLLADSQLQLPPASVSTPNVPGKTWAMSMLKVLLCLVFLLVGGAKLVGHPQMVHVFDLVGVGQWLRVLTGLIEVVAAIALLLPRLAGWSASLLTCTMLGAIGAQLSRIHESPALAVILCLLTAFVARQSFSNSRSKAVSAD